MLLRRPLAAACIAVLLVTGCAPTINPATGVAERTMLSPEQEARLGAAEHPKILEQFGGVYDDPRVTRYVTDLGNRIVAASELAGQPFSFTVLDTPLPNAFALPGGYVYVTRGLLALAGDEAEVAGVLAHEVGHVTARHAAQRYDRQMQGQIGATLATILGAVLLGDAGAQLGQQAGGAAAMAYVQGFSREQEFEADQLGVRYLARAGYDPLAMASFLERLAAEDRLRRQKAGRDPDAPGFSMYASHPRTLDRVARAAAAADGNAGRREPEPFLAIVDGLRYGDDPAGGFVRNGRFVHPGLRFAWPVPAGMALNNRPEAVYGRDQEALQMVFSAERAAAGADLVAAARRGLGDGIVLAQAQPRQVDGRPAALAWGPVSLGGRSGEAAVALTTHEDGRVYRFVFLRPDGFRPADRQRILATFDGFRTLASAEAARYPARRIEVVRAGAADTVASLAARMAVDDLPEETFRVLNGLAPGEAVQPGQTVKLVR